MTVTVVLGGLILLCVLALLAAALALLGTVLDWAGPGLRDDDMPDRDKKGRGPKGLDPS